MNLKIWLLLIFNLNFCVTVRKSESETFKKTVKFYVEKYRDGWNFMSGEKTNVKNVKYASYVDDSFYETLKILKISVEEQKFYYLQKFPELQKIAVNGFNTSDVEVILKYNLTNSVQLEYLDVSRNDLINFNKKMFRKNIQLKVLILSNNKISEISEKLFKYNVNLKELYLKSNKIKKIPRNIFNVSKSLEILHLSDNKIDGLHENLLKFCRNLKEINFDNNKIRFLSEKFFEGLEKLNTISFEDNEIMFLGDWFKHMKSLQLINFASNKISKVSPQFLSGLTADKNFQSNPCVRDLHDFDDCFGDWEDTAENVVDGKLLSFISKLKSFC